MKWQLILSLYIMQISSNKQQEVKTKSKLLFKKLINETIIRSGKPENVAFKSNDHPSVAAILEIMASSKIIDELADILAVKVFEKYSTDNFLDGDLTDSVEKIEVML